ncbi:MAG: NADH:flavin oxidoreductase [Dehalococcoidales bacterium]|nr:MAG: NADH:flavin oxidoreductase [Dehalococcoidales bacterium]
MSEIMFEPCQIGALEIKNRFVRSATWDATADESGAVTDTSVAFYKKLGEGGIGIVVSGHAFVSSLGQATPRQYGVHNDDMIPGLRRLAQAVHEGGGKIALQIAHAGINSGHLMSRGITLPAVSSIPEMKRLHQEMTDEEIEGIIDNFAAAAVRGREAGFDAIQLHGAHGYLMSQVISPLYNHRTDRWGGSVENRRRFLLEIVRRVRQAIGPDFPFFIKYGVMDDQKGGLTLDDGIETARQMVAAGIDAIEVSGGVGQGVYRTGENEPIRTPFRERAAAVKRAVDVPVILVAGIRNLETAQDIVTSGDADMVSMCRPFIREPHLIARWQRGETDPAACITCNKCMAIVQRVEPLECGEDHRLREEAITG